MQLVSYTDFFSGVSMRKSSSILCLNKTHWIYKHLSQLLRKKVLKPLLPLSPSLLADCLVGVGTCTCAYAHMPVLSKNVVITLCSASCNSLFVLIFQVTSVKRMCRSNLKALQPGVLLVQARAYVSVYWSFCLLTRADLSRMVKLLKICCKDKLLVLVSVLLGRYPQPWENMVGRGRVENAELSCFNWKIPL